MRYAVLGACCASVMLLTSACWADAKLLNFEIPVAQRGVGHYSVIFKSERDLRRLPALYRDPNSGVRKPKVLPDVLPISPEDTEALAKALAASVGGKAAYPTAALSDRVPSVFELQGVTDEAAKRLAIDPRIDVIAVPIAVADPGVNRGP